MKKHLLFFWTAFIFIGNAYSQNKTHFGFNADVGAKVFPIKYYNTFASVQAAATLRVENEQQNTLGLLLCLGFMFDPANYKLVSESTSSNKYYIGFLQRNITFSGLIIFPTRKETIEILAGIGMDYNMATDVSFNLQGTNSISTFHSGMGLDSIQGLVDANRRKLLPSASVGLQYQFPQMSRLRLHCLFRQNLLNLFDENVPAYEISTGKTEQQPTNYKPGYLKLGLSYHFAKKRDY